VFGFVEKAALLGGCFWNELGCEPLPISFFVTSPSLTNQCSAKFQRPLLVVNVVPV
jgi:hypothetical protein